MCGIYVTNIPFTEEEVQTKLASIQFRGPDYTGIQKNGDLTFGHLRLAILDLDIRSNQPMEFEEFTIVYNGEIYNYSAIKEELIILGYTFHTTGDTEVLLKGYKEWGEKIVPKLNGMFAFALYNATSNTLFCSRDRLGVKPFYYSWSNGEFEICSQLRPICQNKTLNELAISMYLDCTYIPSPFTIFQDVHKLPPGCNLEIDLTTRTHSVSKYWDLKPIKISQFPYDEAKEKLHELLQDAVKIRLQADVPFGTFLSGGIDSALVSSIAAKISKEPIHTFTIGFEDPKYDESTIAQQFATIIQSQHFETICKPEDIIKLIPKLVSVYDEPFGDSSALPSLLLNKMAKQHVTMALSGDGGDESFLGYNHFDWVSKFKILLKIPYLLRVLASHFLIFDVLGKRTEPLKRILKIKSKYDFMEGIFVGYNSLLLHRNLDWLSSYDGYKKGPEDLHQATADLNIKLWLENDSNAKVDRASMAYSVEIRSPFLDYRVIEFARTLPVSFRYQKGRKKRILKDILKEYIPQTVFEQPKKGFSVPMNSWIRTELKEEFIQNLPDAFLEQIPNLNVPKFKKMFQDHLAGKQDYSSYIWRVYVLSKWYQEFGFYKKENAV
jgi:asparagine synthase (glutamine-hydrolysing)